MTVGERIKSARKWAKLTQKELASRAGTAAGTIQQYELGKRQPRLEQLQRIADALDIPVGELIGTTPMPDREYEGLCMLLNDAGISIEEAGFGEGTGSGGDHFYIWHTDAEAPEEERVDLQYSDLLNIVERVERDAETHKARYIRQRLETELFDW